MATIAGEILDYYNTTGGIDTISASVALGNSKLRDAQNINYFPIGGLQWRKGYTKLNTSPVANSPCNGLYMARFSGNSTVPILTCGSKLYTMATLNGTWVDRTNGLTISSLSSHPVSFAILNDVVCMSNGFDPSWQINSSSVAQTVQGSPSFTSALFNVEYRGYMFWGNTVEGGVNEYDRLRFSDINNPNAFTMLGSNNYIDVALKSGGDLRGAVNFGTYLYLFKRHGIYQINFQPTQVNSSGVVFPFSAYPNPVVPDVGTQSHHSIVKFTTPITNKRQSGVELVFFVDQFGVPRIFDGQTSVQVGFPISQSRDISIPNLSQMDNTQLPYVWAINYPYRNQIMVFMSSSDQQMNTCWVLDYTTDFIWSRHKFANNFSAGSVFEKTNGQWVPFFGDYAGTVYEYDSGTNDAGTAISSYAIWGDAFVQKPSVKCKWPWIEVKGSTGNSNQIIDISVYPDGSDSIQASVSTSVTLASAQTTWGTGGQGGTMTWGKSKWARAGVMTGQKDLGLDAKTLRVKLSNSIKDSQATIEGFALEAIPQGISQL